MLTFSHPGKIGDLLYSLHYCVEAAKSIGDPCFMLNIRTGVTQAQINPGRSNQEVLMTEEAAAFVKPLLDAQPYISHVTINEPGGIDLAAFMRSGVNPMGGDLRDFYYQVDGGMLPREFWRQLISVDRDTRYNTYRECVAIGRTGRYENMLIDWKALEPYGERLVFLGTEKEYDSFCKECFNVQGMIPSGTDSLLDCARFMVTCKGYMGVQSGLYALAEMMKIPRILLTADWVNSGQTNEEGRIIAAPGPKNVLPLGGRCGTACRTDRMIAALRTLLE